MTRALHNRIAKLEARTQAEPIVVRIRKFCGGPDVIVTITGKTA